MRGSTAPPAATFSAAARRAASRPLASRLASRDFAKLNAAGLASRFGAFQDEPVPVAWCRPSSSCSRRSAVAGPPHTLSR